jgi:hypothetical protein
MVMIEIPTDVPELEFWNVRRTTEELQITRSSLQNIRPYLHTLRLPRNTSLFPNYYTNLYKDALSEREGRDLTGPARDLARTAIAQQTAELEEDTLDFLLHESTINDKVYARDVRDLLGISPATFTDWQRRGDIEMEQDGKYLLIPQAAIVAAISWQRPEGMPPAGPLITEPLSPRM